MRVGPPWKDEITQNGRHLNRFENQSTGSVRPLAAFLYYLKIRKTTHSVRILSMIHFISIPKTRVTRLIEQLDKQLL